MVSELRKTDSAPDQRHLAVERSQLQAELRSVRSGLVREFKFLCILAGALGISILLELTSKTETSLKVLLMSLIFPGAFLVYVGIRVIDAWRQVRFSRRALRMFDRILSDIMS